MLLRTPRPLLGRRRDPVRSAGSQRDPSRRRGLRSQGRGERSAPAPRRPSRRGTHRRSSCKSRHSRSTRRYTGAPDRDRGWSVGDASRSLVELSCGLLLPRHGAPARRGPDCHSAGATSPSPSSAQISSRSARDQAGHKPLESNGFWAEAEGKGFEPSRDLTAPSDFRDLCGSAQPRGLSLVCDRMRDTHSLSEAASLKVSGTSGRANGSMNAPSVVVGIGQIVA